MLWLGTWYKLPVDGIMRNLQQTVLTCEVGRGLEVRNAEIAETGLMDDKQQVSPIGRPPVGRG